MNDLLAFDNTIAAFELRNPKLSILVSTFENGTYSIELAGKALRECSDTILTFKELPKCRDLESAFLAKFPWLHSELGACGK